MSLDSKIISEVDVDNFIASLPYLFEYFENRIRCFRAGALKNYLSNYHTLNSDSDTLHTVTGLPIESTYSGIPTYDSHCSFSSKEIVILEGESDKVIDKGGCYREFSRGEGIHFSYISSTQ